MMAIACALLGLFAGATQAVLLYRSTRRGPDSLGLPARTVPRPQRSPPARETISCRVTPRASSRARQQVVRGDPVGLVVRMLLVAAVLVASAVLGHLVHAVVGWIAGMAGAGAFLAIRGRWR